MFFSRQHDDVIADVERRIAEWTHVPVSNGEGIQVLSTLNPKP
jgi:prolyl 4-hydroxylase